MRQAIRLAVAVVTFVTFAVVTTAVPTEAGVADVTVRFGVSTGHYAPGACVLSVPQGTSGTGVLNAAVAKGCIAGYQMDGSWLRCVAVVGGAPVCSDVHTNPLCCGTHYWAIYEDAGAVAPHALSGFSAGNATHTRLLGHVAVQHTELVLSFESWAKCLAYPALCNPDV